jgi:hypothetical protein
VRPEVKQALAVMLVHPSKMRWVRRCDDWRRSNPWSVM